MKRRKIRVDASYRDGRAGLAVTGCLGEFSKVINVSSSNDAEIEAMKWAMELAGKETRLTFYTDATSVVALYPYDEVRDWMVVWVKRSNNTPPNILARQALRAGAVLSSE